MDVSKWPAGLIYYSITGTAIMLSISPATRAEPEAKPTRNEQAFHVRPGQRQLFLDDYGIAKIENLTRTMHQPVKKGAVIRPPPGDPEVRCIQTRTAPIWDPQDNVWKLWDLSTPNDLHAEKIYCGGYYESTDGLHWTRPVVGQLEYRGSRENNYVFFLINDRHCRPDLVVYDPTDPDPSRRFKAAMPPHGFAVSSDGVSWRALDIEGVPSSDEYNFSFDEQEHLFILTVKHSGPYGRSVHLSTSRDFEHWTKPELIFHADELDQELGREHIRARFADPTLHHPPANDPQVYNVDVYNMAVFRYEGLYIGLPAMYHATGPVLNYPNTVGFHLLQLTCSRDLKTWKRLGDRKPFIGPSRLGSGAYDLTQILPPSYPILRCGKESSSGKEELWFYYTGIKYRGTFKYIGKYPDGEHVPLPGLEPDQGAICLAVLRRDGFVSLDAGQSRGVLLTAPFTLRGHRLYLNVDASKGWIRVDILDGGGRLLAASEPLTGDHLRGQVQWTSGQPAALKGRAAALRFTLENASFYSYWLAPTRLSE